MKSIIWLASYPKSGNTWLRAFLANYVFNTKEPVPINQIHRLGMGDSSANAYKRVAPGFNPTDPQDCARHRDAVLKGIVGNKADVNFVKTHCENGTAFGVTLVPSSMTRAAIYILRNPLDVALSFASHYGKSIDETIEGLRRDDNVLLGDSQNTFQFLGNWSNHVLGWTRARGFPVLTLRYEDMQSDPAATFRLALEHIGLPVQDERLERAIRHSSFEELRRQEDKSGFIENSANQQRFFRAGRVGQGKSELSETQMERLRADHRSVMKRFGYLGT